MKKNENIWKHDKNQLENSIVHLGTLLENSTHKNKGLKFTKKMGTGIVKIGDGVIFIYRGVTINERAAAGVAYIIYKKISKTSYLNFVAKLGYLIIA